MNTLTLEIRNIIDRPIDLYNYIQSTLTPKEEEKKKFGEVFTPLSLVNEMLDKLPEEVWTNQDLKWLEPGSGLGNFSICVYLRLMEGLKKSIVNNKKRKRHILENMLYMVELNPKNVMLCRLMMGGSRWEVVKESEDGFDLEEVVDYKLNLYEGDYLKFDNKEVFEVDKFDVIIGNPPYNQFTKTRKATGNTIWQKFIRKNLTLLSKGGYMNQVHPNGWRKPNTSLGKFTGMFKEMVKCRQMLYLEIHNTCDGQSLFSSGTRYDWYVIHNISPYKKTKVKTEDGREHQIIFDDWDWFPNAHITTIQNLLAKDGDEMCKIMYSRGSYGADKKWISKIENNIYKYPIIHSTPKKGVRMVYSKRNDNGHFGIPKIIFGESGIYNVVIDTQGEYGMTQDAMGIQIDSETTSNH